MIVLANLWGCANATPEAPPPEPPPPEVGPTVPTMLGEIPGVEFLGDWTSPGCPGRSYARNIRFEDYGNYAAVDLVAPCPPGQDCGWTGMVGFAGIWKREGDRLELREMGGNSQPGGPHPTRFQSTTEGYLVENGCQYQRGLTVPPGYDEVVVRPRVPG